MIGHGTYDIVELCRSSSYETGSRAIQQVPWCMNDGNIHQRDERPEANYFRDKPEAIRMSHFIGHSQQLNFLSYLVFKVIIRKIRDSQPFTPNYSTFLLICTHTKVISSNHTAIKKNEDLKSAHFTRKYIKYLR